MADERCSAKLRALVGHRNHLCALALYSYAREKDSAHNYRAQFILCPPTHPKRMRAEIIAAHLADIGQAYRNHLCLIAPALYSYAREKDSAHNYRARFILCPPTHPKRWLRIVTPLAKGPQASRQCYASVYLPPTHPKRMRVEIIAVTWPMGERCSAELRALVGQAYRHHLCALSAP